MEASSRWHHGILNGSERVQPVTLKALKFAPFNLDPKTTSVVRNGRRPRYMWPARQVNRKNGGRSPEAAGRS